MILVEVYPVDSRVLRKFIDRPNLGTRDGAVRN